MSVHVTRSRHLGHTVPCLFVGPDSLLKYISIAVRKNGHGNTGRSPISNLARPVSQLVPVGQETIDLSTVEPLLKAIDKRIDQFTTDGADGG